MPGMAIGDPPHARSRPTEPSVGDRFPGVVAGGPMAGALDRLAALADNRQAVLPVGETGTGKSFLAKALHEARRPHPGPFLKVDCASADFEAIAAEIACVVGPAPGAGPAVGAGGGTLVLDGADALLGDGGRLVSRLHAEGRLVVTAQKEPAGGAPAMFVLVRLPPLRERRAEIPDLCRHLLARSGHRDLTLSAGALTALIALGWPGNVRELGNELAWASLFADGGVIGRRHLSDKMFRRPMDPDVSPRRGVGDRSLA